MKKFLSLIGVSILSFALFAGCGGASEEDVENAAKSLMTTLTAVAQNADKLDDTAKADLQEVQKEAMALTASGANMDDPDEALKAITDLDTKLKGIAEKSGIEVK